MKRWIKRTLIGLFGASILFGGLAAWAHKRHEHRWQAMTEEDAAAIKSRIVDKVGSRLDLDAAQRAKLGTLADALRLQRNALVAGSADPRTELQALIAGPSFDRSKASALIEGKVSAINTQSPAVVNAMADFYDSLKPEQQAKVRDFMSRRGGHHRG